MIRAIAACLSLSAALAGPAQAQERGQPQDLGLLAEPGEYGFGTDATRPGGLAGLSVGSRGLRTAAIALQSGPLGDTGLGGFAALQAGRAPDPSCCGRAGTARSGLVSQGAVLGVEKQIGDGATVSIEGGWQHDRWSSSRPGYAVPAGVP